MRLFVAAALSPEVRRGLEEAQQELRSAAAAVRWVRVEGIHLTLRFLGDVDEGKRAPLVAALKAVRGQAFEAAVRGIGFFPNPRRPRVVWAGVEEPTGRLAALQRGVEEAVVRLGFEPEERGEFHPHLTLGRLGDPKRTGRLGEAAQAMEKREFGAFRVPAFQLFRSELRPDGARYSVLDTFPLEGGEG